MTTAITYVSFSVLFFPNVKCFICTVVISWIRRWACIPQTLLLIGMRVWCHSQPAFLVYVKQRNIIIRVDNFAICLALGIDPEDLPPTLVPLVCRTKSVGNRRVPWTGSLFAWASRTTQPIPFTLREIEGHEVPNTHCPLTSCSVNLENFSLTIGPIRPCHFHLWARCQFTVALWTPQPTIFHKGLQCDGVSMIDSCRITRHVCNKLVSS